MRWRRAAAFHRPIRRGPEDPEDGRNNAEETSRGSAAL
jgi:hypothetical protein